MSLHSPSYLESQRCTCDPEHQPLNPKHHTHTHTLHVRTHTHAHTPPHTPLFVLMHCCYSHGSHPAQGKSRFAYTGAGAPFPRGDVCWLRASWLGSLTVSSGTIWGTEHIVSTESFPCLSTETDTQRSWPLKAEVSGKWLCRTEKSWLTCHGRDSNSAHNSNLYESVLYRVLQCANLHRSWVPYLFASSHQLLWKLAVWRVGCFTAVKKEKHKKMEINILTAETNKCSSCLHYIEVFDIPNYDITVGVMVAAVAFVKWSAIPHANK